MSYNGIPGNILDSETTALFQTYKTSCASDTFCWNCKVYFMFNKSFKKCFTNHRLNGLNDLL